MKRILIYMLGLFFTVTSCSVDNDYIFDDISTGRLNQFIDECDSLLLDAENGWKFIYYPDSTQFGGYTFLMRFSEGKRVKMISDLTTEETLSSYGYTSALGPILSFNTYALLHYLADPNPNVYDGAVGIGYGAEYEFLILDVQSEKITLAGNKRRGPAELIPATEADWINMAKQREALANFTVKEDEPFFHYLRINNDTAFFNYSPKLRTAFMTHVENGKTIADKFPVYSTVNGIRFKTPAQLGGATFSEIAFDPTTRKYSIVDDAGIDYEFFRASSRTETCLLHFPGAYAMADGYNYAFSLVERGQRLGTSGNMNLTPGGHGILEFRFYWSLAGHAAGEIYLMEDGLGIATYAGLYRIDVERTDVNNGDVVYFNHVLNSNKSGQVVMGTDTWFGFTYNAPPLTAGASGGTLYQYMTTEGGHKIIPAGNQFYMIHNNDNLAWALYTPLRKNE